MPSFRGHTELLYPDVFSGDILGERLNSSVLNNPRDGQVMIHRLTILTSQGTVMFP